MKKILSLGFILVLCSGLVGCNSLSEKKIEQCKEYEKYLDVTSEWILEDYNEMIDTTIAKEYYGYNRIDSAISIIESTIESKKKDINEVSMDDLKKYHDYLVEYRGTTQEQEDNNFLIVKSKYLYNLLTIAYEEEILLLYQDGELTDEDVETVKK